MHTLTPPDPVQIHVGHYQRQILRTLGMLPAYDAAEDDDERAKLMEIAQRQLWATPQWFVDGLCATLGLYIGLDVCAEASTAKCFRWLGPGSMTPDALVVDWHEYLDNDDVAFCNPPFRFAQPFVEKILRDRVPTILITPGNVGAEWFGLLHEAAVEMLPIVGPRLAFEPPPGIKASSPGGGTLVWLPNIPADPNRPRILRRDDLRL